MLIEPLVSKCRPFQNKVQSQNFGPSCYSTFGNPVVFADWTKQYSWTSRQPRACTKVCGYWHAPL